MKKLTLFASLLALAIGASAQSAITVGPTAHGRHVGGTAIPGPTATNSTVNVPPVAVSPNAVHGKKK